MQNRQFLINISNLPPEQKKHCTDLLTNHDIVFEQENEEFTARIVIDPSIKRPSYTKIKQAEPKRNITETVCMDSFKSLIPLMKTVQVYICPKKLSIEKIEVQLQLILDNYFRSNDVETLIAHNLKGSESFPMFFFNHIAKTEHNKVKFQQVYVNILQSINHFKNKHKGVKVFQLFLSNQYGLQELLFFYFLRKMIETLKSVTIINKNRLKTSLYTLTLQQQHVMTILNSYLSDKHQEMFEEVKKHMRYDTKTKKNIVGGYDFIYILLQNFNKRQNSYEIRQHLLRSMNSSLNSSISREQKSSPHHQSINSKFQFSPSQNLILLGCLEALKKLCEKANLSLSFYDAFSQLISKLLTYIFASDKMGWFQQLSLEPTPARLHYIQSLQQDYLQYQSQPQQTNLLVNRIIRRAMQAPGMQQSYAKIILSS